MSVTLLDGVLQTLSAMERYYRGGSRWTRYSLDDGNGNKCLVGAVTSVRARSSNGASWVPSEEIKAARRFIELAVHERAGSGWRIQTYNDMQQSYHEIAAVIARAKELAMIAHDMQVQQRPAPVPPVIDITPVRAAPELLPPPIRPALPAPQGSSPSFFNFNGLFPGSERVMPNNPWLSPIKEQV